MSSRLLALDIGLQRTGVAMSDELRLTARPLEVVATEQLAVRLAVLLGEYEVAQIIVGRPRNMDGSLGEQAEITQRIAENLVATVPAEYVYEDETATTLAAPNGRDDEAACAMLQGYLTEHCV